MDKEKKNVAVVFGHREAKEWTAKGYKTIDVLDDDLKETLRSQYAKDNVTITEAAKPFAPTLEKEELARTEEPKKVSGVLVNDSILVSNTYTPAEVTAKAWLGRKHLDLIERLLDEGFNLKIVDEAGNIVE